MPPTHVSRSPITAPVRRSGPLPSDAGSWHIGRGEGADDELGTTLAAADHGDPLAFADLYASTAPRIFGQVLRVLGDAHQAEEVTQEVFLQVWLSRARFDPARGTAVSWLLTIAHRRAVDRVRHSEAARRRDAADVDRSQGTSYDETVAGVLASLDAQTVRVALAALSPLQRQAVTLAHLEGYTHREVAALLRVPLGTAKCRIRDGLVKLRAMSSAPVPHPGGRLSLGADLGADPGEHLVATPRVA